MVKSFFNTIKKPFLVTFIIAFFLLVIPFEIILRNNLNPFIFGISFFIINLKTLKFNFIVGFLLSVLLCYLAYFIGFVSFFGLTKIFELATKIMIDADIFILFSGFIASITLYMLFSKVYYIFNFRKGLIIMLVSYLLVAITMLTFALLFDNTNENEFFVVYNSTWLLVVGFTLTLSTNLDKENKNDIELETKPNT